MSGYSMEKNDYDKSLDLQALKPYGDTMNDGKVQVSFTLPVENDERAGEAAKELAKKMGLREPIIALAKSLDLDFTFFVVYGSLIHTVNYKDLQVTALKVDTLSMKETDALIQEKIGRKIVVIGAATGTDAHTVGIDAIMNMKGYAGHYGLERYQEIEAYNLGSQVENYEFIKKAKDLNADVLLVSQTVTQKNIHIKNLTDLVEMAEAEGIRDDLILICGGPRVTHKLAKELGYDAGFGFGKFADDVATYMVKELIRRKEGDSNEKC